MLDDANDLVIAGQIFANSHPHWTGCTPMIYRILIVSSGVKNFKAF
jgi:hypothetical protein